MDPVKLGYVGCGFMAQKVHIPNSLRISECDLVAIAEVRAELGQKVQDRYRVPKLYKDHLELAADSEIEAVAVSADFALQGEIAKDLLSAGKCVFMEKPMAVSVKQAESLLETAKSANTKLMVGYMKRYDAGNELVKLNVAQFRQTKELGHITYVRNHGFCGDWICNLDAAIESTDETVPSGPRKVPEWLPSDRVGSYLGYLQQYTHNINLLRWFLDAGDDVRVKMVDFDEDGYSGIVIFEMAGIRVTLESGGISHYRWDEHTQIYFQHGWVHTWAPPLLLKNTSAEVEIYRAGEDQQILRPIPKPRWAWAYHRELEHFIKHVRTDRPFRSSGEDSLTDVRLYEEIYKKFLNIN